MKTVTLTMPLDMHVHLRDGDMLKIVAPLTSYTFSGALVMPNLVPPITTKEMVKEYRSRIKAAMESDDFEPYMTLFYQNFSREFLESVQDDITAIKIYPSGATTNSQGGVVSFDIEPMRETLEAMSDFGIVLCVHGETQGFVMDREAEFMSVYEKLAINFPKLKIIMEHITTREAVEMLDRHPNLYATITVHHLMITLDDVAGGMLRPHLFCKPIAKRPHDRDALLKIALQAHPKVMFGSDSAPHPKHAKESCGCGAGVFTAPIALQLLCEIFQEHNALDNLQAFVSDNAQRIYGICAEYKEVVLVERDFVVPEIYADVVPMRAGETLTWSIERVD
ncbi:MAG: dihydroorotase [Campylobacterota bacterium]|nr:dihydroorotase [Campylobacterota bacterium]